MAVFQSSIALWTEQPGLAIWYACS